VQDKVVVTTYR